MIGSGTPVVKKGRGSVDCPKPCVIESDVEASTVYGTERMNGYHIIDKLLNQGNIAVYDTVKNDNGNDSRVLNRVETIAAREKAEQVQNAFKTWIFRDPEHRGYLVEKFNDLYNSERARQYDGSHLTFPHMSPTIELRPHQVNAVCRTIHGGNSLFYHCVGAGKTFTMIAAAMNWLLFGKWHYRNKKNLFDFTERKGFLPL